MLMHQEHRPAAAVDLERMNSGSKVGLPWYGLGRERALAWALGRRDLGPPPQPGAWPLTTDKATGEPVAFFFFIIVL